MATKKTASGRARHKRTALLLIDFINLFDFEGASRLGPRAVRAAQATATLKGRMKKAGVSCIYTNDNFGNWRSDFAALVDECAGSKGHSSAIVAAIRPEKDDLAVLKPRHSAFYGTPLDFLLEELRVQNLILTGIALDMCVFATAQDAHVRQFDLWIPRNCVAGFTTAEERSALAHMARTLKADIRPGPS